MQISNRTFAASVVGTAAAIAATQSAGLAVTWPIAIGPEAAKVVLPLLMAIVPILLTAFAPGLLPLWERIKGWLPVPAELQEYKRAIRYANDDPACPIMHRKAKGIIETAFEKHHPNPVPQSVVVVPGVSDAK